MGGSTPIFFKAFGNHATVPAATDHDVLVVSAGCQPQGTFRAGGPRIRFRLKIHRGDPLAVVPSDWRGRHLHVARGGPRGLLGPDEFPLACRSATADVQGTGNDSI